MTGEGEYEVAQITVGQVGFSLLREYAQKIYELTRRACFE